jgi:tetratricopeptide (TPR) repeat protein
MDILNQIVEVLNKEEIRFYKLFALRQQGNSERKDLFLLDALRKNPDASDEKIFRKLYPDGDKNAYYRLRNRLLEDINRSLMLQHYEDEELLMIFHQLTVVRIYTAKNQYQLAFHFLRKAEQKALKTENHEILDIIYGEFIRLSNELMVINPETYVSLRRKNSETLNRLRQMDDLLAVVSYRLKTTQNFGEKQNSLMGILEETTNSFMQDAGLAASPRFRFKLYSLVSQMLLQKQDYVSLEAYLKKTIAEFTSEHLFNKTNHEIKLQMLTYLVNSLFKTGKIDESLQYSDALHDAMLEFNSLHFERFEIFYYNSLVNNYSTFDIPKAISILQDLLNNKNLRKVPFYELFVYLNLATSYFDLHQYNQAIRHLSKAYLIDSYKKADASLKFKIAVAELIIRYENGDLDFWNYRKDQIVRENQAELEDDKHLKEKELLKILIKAAADPDGIKSRKLRPSIETYLKVWENSEQESEVIRYLNWLRDKIK